MFKNVVSQIYISSSFVQVVAAAVVAAALLAATGCGHCGLKWNEKI